MLMEELNVVDAPLSGEEAVALYAGAIFVVGVVAIVVLC